jgi:hypothetical protein
MSILRRIMSNPRLENSQQQYLAATGRITCAKIELPQFHSVVLKRRIKRNQRRCK